MTDPLPGLRRTVATVPLFLLAACDGGADRVSALAPYWQRYTGEAVATFAGRSEALAEAVRRFCASDSPATPAAARGALSDPFRDAALAWAAFRGIEYPGIEAEGLTFRIWFWPDVRNRTASALTDLLAGGGRITQAGLGDGPAAAEGLGAVEWLLWAAPPTAGAGTGVSSGQATPAHDSGTGGREGVAAGDGDGTRPGEPRDGEEAAGSGGAEDMDFSPEADRYCALLTATAAGVAGHVAAVRRHHAEHPLIAETLLEPGAAGEGDAISLNLLSERISAIQGNLRAATDEGQFTSVAQGWRSGLTGALYARMAETLAGHFRAVVRADVLSDATLAEVEAVIRALEAAATTLSGAQDRRWPAAGLTSALAEANRLVEGPLRDALGVMTEFEDIEAD